MAFLQSTQYGAQLVSTNVWDPSNIYASNIDPELKEILVFMYQNLNRMAQVINVKETGQYNDSFATLNNQQWFANPANNSTTMATAAQRNVFRTVVYFPKGLPDAGPSSLPHYITCTSETTFTRIYGVASDTTGFLYIPLPFVDVTGTNPVQVDVDATNVNITTITDLRKYNIAYIVVEYLLS